MRAPRTHLLLLSALALVGLVTPSVAVAVEPQHQHQSVEQHDLLEDDLDSDEPAEAVSDEVPVADDDHEADPPATAPRSAVDQAVTVNRPSAVGTSLASPVLDGSGTPGAEVTVSVDGAPVGSTTVNGDGFWLFRVPLVLDDGTRQLTVSQPDGTTAASTVEVTSGDVVRWGPATGGAELPADRDYVQVVGHAGRGLALTTEGEVVGWGERAFEPPAALAGEVVVHLSMDGVSGNRAVAVTASGRVVDVGTQQTVAPGGFDERIVSAQLGFSSAIGSALALTESGRVLVLSTGAPVPAFEGRSVVAVDSSVNTHSILARAADGEVLVSAGSSNLAVADVPGDLDARDLVQVAATVQAGFAIRADGTLVGWGAPSSGTLSGLVEEFGDHRLREIAIQSNVGYAVTADGALLQWGLDFATQGGAEAVGDSTVLQARWPGIAIVAPAPAPDEPTPVSVASPTAGERSDAVPLVRGSGTPGATVTVAVDGQDVGSTVVNDEGYWLFRVPRAMPLGDRAVSAAQDVDGSHDTIEVTVVGHAVTAWGANDSGQTDVAPVLDDLRVVQGATGGPHGNFGLGLTDTGRVVAWGDGDAGQTTVPAALADEHVVQVAAGHLFGLALVDDGTVVSWGGGSVGNLGVPAELDGRRVVKVAAGGYAAYALLDDGSVVAWGNDLNGQATLPPELDGRTMVHVEGGGNFALALTADGTVHAWGIDGAGQTRVPGEVQGRTVSVTAGHDFAGAVLDDGRAVLWGQDGSGQLDVPPEIQGRVAQVDAGRAFVVALTTDGTVSAWGAGEYGQLEVPDWVSRTVVSQVAASERDGYALVDLTRITAPAHGGSSVVRPSLGGRAAPGLPVTVSRVSEGIEVPVGTALAGTDGRWSLPAQEERLASGPHTFVATSAFGSVHEVEVTVGAAPQARLEVAPRVVVVDRL